MLEIGQRVEFINNIMINFEGLPVYKVECGTVGVVERIHGNEIGQFKLPPKYIVRLEESDSVYIGVDIDYASVLKTI